MNLRDRLIELLEPGIAELGLVLWELEYLPRSNGALLRLYIDVPIEESADVQQDVSDDVVTEGTEVAEAGITVDDCERASHTVSEVLDAQDPIPGHYTLEVSSPGLDRVLRTREHFARFVGEAARVEMATAIKGRKRFAGRLMEVKETTIALLVDGQIVELALADVRKARLAPELS
jgi:ribosome maturation factor RimP